MHLWGHTANGNWGHTAKAHTLARAAGTVPASSAAMNPARENYRTIRDMLTAYAKYCQRGEVDLRDATGSHEPADLLASLSRAELDAHILTVSGNGVDPDEIIARSEDGTERLYRRAWSPDRMAWAKPSAESRIVHFFMPRHPTNGAVLFSLCKRSCLANCAPFWPEENPQYCKRCTQLYHVMFPPAE